MASWSRNKVDASNLNSGNEYSANDQVAREELNAMVNAGLYAQDFAERLADTPDTSDAGTVGTPTVTIVDNIVGGKTYKKFKFSNLKGERGGTGALYPTTGQNTDGSMTQKAISDELSDIVEDISATSLKLLWTGNLGTNNATITLSENVTNYDMLLICGDAWSSTGFTFLVGTTKLQPAYTNNYTSATFNSAATGYGMRDTTTFYVGIQVNNSNNQITYYTGYDNTASNNQGYLRRIYGVKIRRES